MRAVVCKESAFLAAGASGIDSTPFSFFRSKERFRMIDLYFWPTGNGKKISIMLEETGLPYRIIPVNINKGDQFTPEYDALNPNNKMPAIVDRENADAPLTIFES